MKHNKMISRIEQKRRGAVASIRDYVRAQKELWQQVPYLALYAQGRGDFQADYQRAYTTGCWKTSDPSVHIDCATGELVCLPQEREDESYEVPDLAADHLVNNLDIGGLDARIAIADLLQEQKKKNSPMEDFHTTKEHRTPNGWRQAEARRCKVGKKYRRAA